MTARVAAGTQAGSFRIIAGQWRGRRLPIPDHPGLRPTPDRVRETLFNWLAPVLPGARCLDLFAGAGALGFEAASRGAARVTLVDQVHAVTESLRAAAQRVGASNVEVVQAEALAFLRGSATPYDIVFLDPPYAAGLLPGALDLVHAGPWVAPGGRLYLEHDADEQAPELPGAWRYLRSKRTRQVGYHLIEAA